MAKVALINDNHSGARNDSIAFHNHMSRCFSWFFSYLNDNNIKDCIHLGDLFDRRKYLNYATARRCREDFLLPLCQYGIKTHILAGNHDCYHKNTNDTNALVEILGDRYQPYITVYPRSKEISIDGLDILLLPWIAEDNYDESINAINTSRCEIVMGHLELLGFERYKGSIADHGLDKKLFSRFDVVFSGHYHHKSSIDNVTYLGAFTEFIWSDYNDPRGFHVFDTETRALEFIKNPHKIFHMISYDDVKYTDIIERIMEKDYSEHKDCYVKVVCVNKTNPYAFDMLLDKLYKVSPLDISVVEDISTFTDNDESNEIDQTEDTPTLLDHYIENLTLQVDNDKMKSYMRKLHMEALSLENVE